MGPPTAEQWDVRPLNLFRLHQVEDTETSALCGNLLIEVDNKGQLARHFRYAIFSDELITVTVPAKTISSLPGCEAFSISMQFRPDEITLRDNTFSQDWMDVTDLVRTGKALPTIDDTDHVEEFLHIAEMEHDTDHTKGGVLRWCINVTHTEELELCLQCLPLAISAVKGRPALMKDSCPASIIWRHHIESDYIVDGPLKGPKPTLFAADQSATVAAISTNSSAIKTGKILLTQTI